MSSLAHSESKGEEYVTHLYVFQGDCAFFVWMECYYSLTKDKVIDTPVLFTAIWALPLAEHYGGVSSVCTSIMRMSGVGASTLYCQEQQCMVLDTQCLQLDDDKMHTHTSQISADETSFSPYFMWWKFLVHLTVFIILVVLFLSIISAVTQMSFLTKREHSCRSGCLERWPLAGTIIKEILGSCDYRLWDCKYKAYNVCWMTTTMINNRKTQ